jgi:sterol 24-C-methyltransferase
MAEKRVIRRSKDAVQKELPEFNELSQDLTSVDKRKAQYKTLVTNYYSLTTDGYEFAGGKSFHCANRFHGETFEESMQRHESYLALRMQLKPGDKVLDIGCGVGGPLRRIAYLTGAHVTGITISEYQVQRARTIGKDPSEFFFETNFEHELKLYFRFTS